MTARKAYLWTKTTGETRRVELRSGAVYGEGVTLSRGTERGAGDVSPILLADARSRGLIDERTQIMRPEEMADRRNYR